MNNSNSAFDFAFRNITTYRKEDTWSINDIEMDKEWLSLKLLCFVHIKKSSICKISSTLKLETPKNSDAVD